MRPVLKRKECKQIRNNAAKIIANLVLDIFILDLIIRCDGKKPLGRRPRKRRLEGVSRPASRAKRSISPKRQ